MITKCPSCQKDVEHEDFLFEVLCSCGARFNPFMPAEVPAFEVPSEPNPQAPIAPEPSPELGAELSEGFEESRAVFDELRSFGETMGLGETPSAPKPAAPPAATPQRSPSPETSQTTGAQMSGTLVTCADVLSGMRIEAYRGAVSAAVAFDPGAASPLQGVFSALATQATSQGANAVISVRWIVLADGSFAIASGTAVHAASESP